MVKVAIIGAGDVGHCLGKALANKGYSVVFGSRDPKSEKVQKVVADVPHSIALPLAEVAKSADVVALCTPWQGAKEAITSLGDLKGKIVIDVTNPLGPQFTLVVGRDNSGGEEVARWAVGAKVVKAFNTIGCNSFLNPVFNGQKADLYIAGDDAEAKKVVSQMGSDLGFEPIDVGGIAGARVTEPLAVLWITLAYPLKWGRDHAFKLVKRT